MSIVQPRLVIIDPIMAFLAPDVAPRRTLQAARRRLGILSQRVWTGQKLRTYWLLSGQTLPASIAPEDRRDDVDKLFAAVKAKYPDDPLEEE